MVSLGEWRSLAFRGYVDITPDLDRDMSKLLLETDDLESDLNDEVGLWARHSASFASDFGRWNPAANLDKRFTTGSYVI